MSLDTQRDFGTRECPSCACEVAANENRCPICGYVFPTLTPMQQRMRSWGGWLMLLLFLIMVLGLMRLF